MGGPLGKRDDGATVPQSLRDLWAAFCGRDALFTERDGLRERIGAMGDPGCDLISRAEVLALLGGEAPTQDPRG